MQSITVYSQPHCPPCRLTKRKLNELELDYVEEDAREHVEYLAGLSFRATPVVLVRDEETGEVTQSWSGYCPALIEELAGRV